MLWRLLNKVTRFLPRPLRKLVEQGALWLRAAWIGAVAMRSGRVPPPRTVTIDPMSACNLRCPLCNTGIGALKGKRLSMECFEKYMQQVPFVRDLLLFKWGEPFLHNKIFDMIRYASTRGIRTTISSNFSIERDDAFFDNIVDSGLTTLIISLDGASPESYSKYRVGGDFDLVFSNMTRLAAAKRRQRAAHPEIIWQFLVNRWNEHETDRARHMAADVGVTLKFGGMGLADDLPDFDFPGTLQARKDQWLPRLPQNQEFVAEYYNSNESPVPLEDNVCKQIFKHFVVNPEGFTHPCCWASDTSRAFGDLNQQSFTEIWNSERYTQSRLLSLGVKTKRDNQSICWNCVKFTRTPSLAQKIDLFMGIARAEARAYQESESTLDLTPEAEPITI